MNEHTNELPNIVYNRNTTRHESISTRRRNDFKVLKEV